MQTWICCYDISEDKTRDELAQLLMDHGQRRQYSVFECRLTFFIKQQLDLYFQHLIESGDSIRWYPLCRHCLKRSESLGVATLPDKRGYQIL